VGVISLLLMFWAPAGERSTVALYAGITLAVAGLLALVKGGRKGEPSPAPTAG
jgi:hypothetical protein